MGTNRATVVKIFASATALILCLAGCASVPSGSGSSQSPSPSAVPTASRLVISGDKLAVESSDGTVLSSIEFTGDVAAARASLTTLIGGEPTVTHVAKSSCNLDYDKYDWNGLSLMTSGSVPFRADKAFSIAVTAPKVGGPLSLESPDGTTVGMSADTLKASTGAIDDKIEGRPGFTYDTTPVAGDDGVFSGAHVSVNADGTVNSFRAPSLAPDFC